MIGLPDPDREGAVVDADAARAFEDALVVACGSPLRGDDGVGPAVGELLEAALEGSGATVVVRDQLLPELAMDVSRARCVVFVDADAARPAGSVRTRPVCTPAPALAGGGAACTGASPGAAEPLSRALEPFSHGMGPAEVMALARDLYAARPPAALVSVGAESFEPGAGLSRAVRRAVRPAARRVIHAIDTAPIGARAGA